MIDWNQIVERLVNHLKETNDEAIIQPFIEPIKDLEWLFWLIKRPSGEIPQVGYNDECWKELDKLEELRKKYLEGEETK